MNKRINELIEQSYDEVPHERDWDATTKVFNKRKFAELIIRECADAGDMAHEARCDYIGDYIVEHFDLGADVGAATYRCTNESEN